MEYNIKENSKNEYYVKESSGNFVKNEYNDIVRFDHYFTDDEVANLLNNTLVIIYDSENQYNPVNNI